MTGFVLPSRFCPIIKVMLVLPFQLLKMLPSVSLPFLTPSGELFCRVSCWGSQGLLSGDPHRFHPMGLSKFVFSHLFPFRMLYSTPQLLDQYIWVPVRDTFIHCCGHTGMTVLAGTMEDPAPPLAMVEAAERGLHLPYRTSSVLDPAGSVPGDWRDRAIRAGRPSTLLRHEALVACDAAAQQALVLQQAQVEVDLAVRY